MLRRRMRPVISFASDVATVWRPVMRDGRPVMQPAVTVPLTGDAATSAAEGRAAMASLVSSAAPGKPRVVVSVAQHDILRKRIVMPAAVEENLRQVLAYDLDRHTPFKAEELYFDARVVERQPARSTVTVDLAAARRASVDPALKHVAAWGADVAAVVPAPPENAAESRLNLLPPELRTSRSLLRRWQFWVPVLLLAAMALAAIAIPLWQKRVYALELAAEADQARTRAAVSETLRAQLNARVADYNYALDRKYTFPGALAIVDTVSKVLPDDTWLTQFELKTIAKGKEMQRELSLRGETSNAGRLVQLFEESEMFMQAAQRGPTTKIQPGPGEIFDLGAQLRPRKPPQTVALMVSDTPAAAPPAPATVAPGTAPPSPTTPAPGTAPPSPAPPAPGTAPPAPATPAPGAPAASAPPPAATPAAAVSSPAIAPPVPAATSGSPAPATAAPDAKAVTPAMKGKS